MADEYRNLSYKEQAILKLPVFFDSYDNYYHPIREEVVNCRDILLNSKNGLIEVTLHDDNRTVTIKDNGCGIKLDGESNGKPNWEHAFLILFSGSKMSAGKTSGGTNGCGNTIINYSSDLMEITSKRDGKIYHIKFINGGEIAEPFECLGDTTEHGTEITFKLCDKIYTNTVFDENEVRYIVERIVVTSPNITSIFRYKDKEYKFNFKDLSTYFDYKDIDRKISDIKFNTKEYESEFYNIDKKENDIEKTTINLIVNLSDESKLQYPFLNGIYLPQMDENFIRKGIIEGFRDCLNKFIKDNGLYIKKEKQITKQDIEDSISYICSIESTNVSYTSQTKFSTKKELYEKLLKQYIKEFMDSYCIENRKDILTFANQILINKRSREKSETSRKDIRKKLEEGISNINSRPEKFVPCRSKNPKEIDFILIEGDSAELAIENSRDSRTMCIMPLKGKPINAIKKDINSVINNEVVKNIFTVLGCGMEYKGKQIKGIPKFNINNMNVQNILICRDMDVDGQHIESLVIALFYTLAPELIKQKRVFILDTPLYAIWIKNKPTIYAYSQEERNSIVKDLEKNKIKFTERYFKGLGGLSSQILNETAMNVDNRKLTCVKWEDIDKGIKMMNILMSDEHLSERKELIENEGNNYFDFSLIED